jgi:hypothetical protein
MNNRYKIILVVCFISTSILIGTYVKNKRSRLLSELFINWILMVDLVL